MSLAPVAAQDADIAIVGAGIAGLSCAARLAAAGRRVVLFDKGRGLGGRMATRRMETPLGPVAFDMGAQFFTARDPQFAAEVAEWARLGLAERWPAAREDAWIGVPAMNAVVKHLGTGHDIRLSSHVSGFVREPEGWRVLGKGIAARHFSTVVLAVPAEQAAPLLSLQDFALGMIAHHARSRPCWTAMFSFDRRLPMEDNIVRESGAIGWAARSTGRPGRPARPGSAPESWVVQAEADWSAEHLERPADEIHPLLLAELEAALGTALPAPVASAAHRWRYALSAASGEGCLWNPVLRLGACGDWLLGPRVECAWLSGRILADRMMESARKVA